MTTPLEFSRLIAVDRIGSARKTQKLVADAAERAALAKRLDLVAIDRLEALVTLRRVRAGLYLEMVSELQADVVQTDVVTLDPLPAQVADKTIQLFGPLRGRPDLAEIDLSSELNDPEPFDGAEFDMGEQVAQQLSLALDPHPRAATSDSETSEAGDSESGASPAEKSLDVGGAGAQDPAQEERQRPFAVLAQLKKQR